MNPTNPTIDVGMRCGCLWGVRPSESGTVLEASYATRKAHATYCSSYLFLASSRAVIFFVHADYQMNTQHIASFASYIVRVLWAHQGLRGQPDLSLVLKDIWSEDDSAAGRRPRRPLNIHGGDKNDGKSAKVVVVIVTGRQQRQRQGRQRQRQWQQRCVAVVVVLVLRSASSDGGGGAGGGDDCGGGGGAGS